MTTQEADRLTYASDHWLLPHTEPRQLSLQPHGVGVPTFTLDEQSENLTKIIPTSKKSLFFRGGGGLILISFPMPFKAFCLVTIFGTFQIIALDITKNPKKVVVGMTTV